MKTIILLLICIFASGCVSVTDITPAGKNTYMVGTSAKGGLMSDAEVAAKSIKKANEFCASKNQVIQIISTNSSGVQMWTPQENTLMFSCVD